jgi:hypothetical protein
MVRSISHLREETATLEPGHRRWRDPRPNINDVHDVLSAQSASRHVWTGHRHVAKYQRNVPGRAAGYDTARRTDVVPVARTGHVLRGPRVQSIGSFPFDEHRWHRHHRLAERRSPNTWRQPRPDDRLCVLLDEPGRSSWVPGRQRRVRGRTTDRAADAALGPGMVRAPGTAG